MVVSFFVFETRGGALLQEFTPAQYSWGTSSNEADQVDVTIDLSNDEDARREWRNLGTPWKHSIAVDVDGKVVGGPIMPHSLDTDAATLKITARGIRVALARRSVLPVAAMSQSLLLPGGTPDTSLDTTFSAVDAGTIGKKITQQAFAWPGWTDIPITYHADRVGTSSITVSAIERKKVDAVLTDLSSVDGGPDIRFKLAWDGSDKFRWFYESGTAETPRLQGATQFEWEIADSSGLRVTTNPTRMGSLAWSEGGRSNDRTLVARQYDSWLVDNGFPLLEIETDASSNIATQATLDAWNAEALRTARKPWEFWSFNVPTGQSPWPYEYFEGDLAKVIVSKDQPVAGGYIPEGSYTRRIVALSGDDSGDWVTITCGEVY